VSRSGNAPSIIHKDQLAKVAPLWYDITQRIVKDPWAKQGLGWLSDMWGYVIAVTQVRAVCRTCGATCFCLSGRWGLALEKLQPHQAMRRACNFLCFLCPSLSVCQPVCLSAMEGFQA
jgi:hypothetical protein